MSMSFGQRDLEGELRCRGQEAEKKGHLHVCADNNDPKARAWEVLRSIIASCEDSIYCMYLHNVNTEDMI